MNIFQVAQVDKSLTVNDMRVKNLPSMEQHVWIYWEMSPMLGSRTGFKHVRKFRIEQMEVLVVRLQKAIDLARKVEDEST